MSNSCGKHRRFNEESSRRGFLKLGTLAICGLSAPNRLWAESPADESATRESVGKPAPGAGLLDKSTSGEADITATFSIVAVDPVNHVCGAAVASKYPAVGKVVPYVRADVGAFCTQHYHVPKWGEPALDMLQHGKRPEAVIFELLKDDKDADLRQLAIIDMQGRAAVHNPTSAGVDTRVLTAPNRHRQKRIEPA